jgi:Co/Zn/Cd efflux system component
MKVLGFKTKRNSQYYSTIKNRYRAEVMGAMTSVLLIWIVTAVLVYLAIKRLISGEYEIEALIMIITASLGVLINIM